MGQQWEVHFLFRERASTFLAAFVSAASSTSKFDFDFGAP
jgi:hypothetical protein